MQDPADQRNQIHSVQACRLLMQEEKRCTTQVLNAHHISVRKDGFGKASSLQCSLQLSALAPVRQPQSAQELRGSLYHMYCRAGLRQGRQPMLQSSNAYLHRSQTTSASHGMHIARHA